MDPSACRPWSGFLPRRPQANAGFGGTSLSLQDLFAWGASSSPMDIPGASPPTASARCRLTVSLPENADAALSRTLEQCCTNDQIPNHNPRSSLREGGVRTPRDVSKVVGMSGGQASWPARKGSSRRHWRLVPNIRETNNSPRVGVTSGDTKFVKNKGTRNRVEGHVSVLSVALRGLADPGGSRPGPPGGAADPAEHNGTGRWNQRG